ncbi:hypothetical protein G7074_00360 [Pedobacter sp. HDW13]|uniref:hypothetical protein n=1 Tax=Pedobacter sp. HDW13 TaxID=2714940 RepID=UPI00140AF0CE|nr:hypothetical protein [Pedobacter sp. HDW13]QIL37873.1 hypothetical protein G7074_00360 [Pedobacter sp. HDW13]
MPHPSGIDRSQEYGEYGSDGNTGSEGISGIFVLNDDNLTIASKLPTSYFRIMLLEAEYQYINNNIDQARQILEWIIEICSTIKKSGFQYLDCMDISRYLRQEPQTFYLPLFDRARIYFNQINQSLDFFGYTSNHINILGSSFIGDEIEKLYVPLKDFKNKINEILSNTQDKVVFKAKSQEIINSNEQSWIKLIVENTELISTAEKLNVEIGQRQNRISVYRNSILEKEEFFKRAVRSAKDDCNLANMLNTVTKLVSIGVAIYSGVGTVGAFTSLLSDSKSILSDFSDLIGENEPGFDLDSWNSVFNDGGENSIVNRVRGIQGKGNDFISSINKLSDVVGQYNSLEKKDELISIHFDANNAEEFNKKEFLEQMKSFVLEFDEARIYQNEVLSFIDFCDITNQKRIEYTSYFLNICLNISKIQSLKDSNLILKKINFMDDQTSLSYSDQSLLIDSYSTAKLYFLKLLYIQNKSISYFTLTNRPFLSQYYKKDLELFLNDGIMKNSSLLLDYLITEGYGRELKETLKPVEIRKEDYKISFQKFINGDDQKVHTLIFRIDTKNNFLADFSEVFVKTIKLRLDNVKTDTNLLFLKLKHMGNSKFIKANTKNEINFSHYPVVKTFYYTIGEEKKMKFSNMVGSYEIDGVQPYMEISPFAVWELTVDGNLENNNGLDLSECSKIELDFEFFHKEV